MKLKLIAMLALLITSANLSAMADDRQTEINSITIQLKKDLAADKTSELEGIKRRLDALIDSKAEAPLYLLRADLKFRMYDLNGALSDYDKAIAIKPDAGTYLQRGIAQCVAENYQLALNDLNQAITLGARTSDAYRNRAGAKEQLGLKQEAIFDLNQALNMEKDPERIWQEKLMRARCEFALKQFDSVIKDTNDVLAYKNLPEDASTDAHKLKGSSLFFMANYKDAVPELTTAASGLEGTTRASVIYLRGAAYHHLNDNVKAELDLAECKKLGFPPSK